MSVITTGSGSPTAINIFQRYNSTPTSPEAWGRAVDVKNMQTYAIQKGDTLYTLSEALFGDSQFWPKIWALNRNDITNPHFIRPGMVIQFIPGTATQAPALNLAAVESSTPTTQQSTAATDEVVAEFKPDVDPVNGKDYSRQDTEFQKLTFDSHGPKKKNFKIPDSFPGYKVPDMRDRNTTQMQLKPRRDLPDPQVPNPFYLSADEVTADLKVESENADDLFCRAEQYVPKVTLLNPTAPQGQYALLVAETEMLGLLEKTYLYRRIGSAVLDADGALRVKDCHSLINTDIVIVNESKLNQLTAPVESKSQDKTLIVAGLDAYKQNYIYRSQYVLVDVSRLGQVQTGRELNIFSKASGQKPTGRLRLLNQQGTLAVAYVIESQDVIQVGDFISE